MEKDRIGRFLHAKQRASERYNLEYDQRVRRAMIETLTNGQFLLLLRQKNERNLLLFKFDGRFYTVWYDSKDKEIMTFIPPTSITKILRTFGSGNGKEEDQISAALEQIERNRGRIGQSLSGFRRDLVIGAISFVDARIKNPYAGVKDDAFNNTFNSNSRRLANYSDIALVAEFREAVVNKPFLVMEYLDMRERESWKGLMEIKRGKEHILDWMNSLEMARQRKKLPPIASIARS